MSNHFNQLTPAQLERIAILAEECSEVVQVCMKIMRHGLDNFNPLLDEPITNKELLEKEIGHINNIVQMMIESGDIRQSEVSHSQNIKRAKIHRWLHHQKGEKE